MKAECPNCGIGYQIDDSKIPDKGAYATCAKCRTRFHIKKPKAQNGEPKQEDIVVCPKCGHVDISSEICASCGIVFSKYYEAQRKVEEEAKKQKVEEEAKRRVMMVKCEACGKTISKNANSCPHCGEPAGEEKARVETQEETEKKLEADKTTKGCLKTTKLCLIGFLGFIVICLIIVFSIFFTSGDKSKPAKGKTSISQISQDVKSLAIDQINSYPGVKDAAIIQKGNEINLAIVVNYATSKSYAKELGDNFVRIVKGLSEDTPPGKEIGEGIYSYSIGVFYPDKKRIVIGAKHKIATRISWW